MSKNPSYISNTSKNVFTPRIRVKKKTFFLKLYIVGVIQAFSIVNTFFFLGVILVSFINPEALFLFSFVHIDFGIVFLIQSWTLMFTAPILIFAILLGFVIASIWARKTFGKKYVNVILLASQVPATIFFFILITTLITLIPLLGIIIIQVIQIFLLGYLGVILASVILSLVGLFIANFVSYESHYTYKLGYDPYFLELDTISHPTDEPVSVCPFKFEDRNGCSFLGYEARPDNNLICDFESTYTRCNVYSHIYSTLEEDRR